MVQLLLPSRSVSTPTGCHHAVVECLLLRLSGRLLPRTSENSYFPRTPMNKGLEPPSAGYMEPLWGRETLARQGANADERNADERASPKGSEQKHPAVGTRALLQQRDYVGGPRLLRRRGHLLRAQGQGQRHSALHLRADRRSEDSRGRRAINRLASVARFSLPRTLIRHSSHRLGSGVKGGITPPR